MSRMQRAAILLSLLGHLRSSKSWCGETHIQKTTYFLQELFEVPLSFEFVLYKHGPFSFDLNNEITALRADYLVTVQTRPPYGPSILPSQEGESLVARYPKTCALFEGGMRFVAEELGPRNVTDLEKLTTALGASHWELERVVRSNAPKPVGTPIRNALFLAAKAHPEPVDFALSELSENEGSEDYY
jgi:hypothetical protein